MKYFKIETSELRQSDLAVFARLYPSANDVCNGKLKEFTIPLSADYNGVEYDNAISLESLQCVFYALHADFHNLGLVPSNETDCNGHVYQVFKLQKVDDYELTTEIPPKRLKKRPSSATTASKATEKANTVNKSTSVSTGKVSEKTTNSGTTGDVQPDIITVRFDVTDMVGEISKLAQNYGKFELKKLAQFEEKLFELFDKNN